MRGDPADRPRLNVPVRPFPWTSLDSIGRRDGTRIGQVRRFVASLVDLPMFRARLEAISGERTFVRLRSIGPARPSDPTALAVKLTQGGREILVLEAEATFAALLVRKAMQDGTAKAGAKRSNPRAIGRAPSHEMAAAFAAVIADGLRRSVAPGAEPVRVAAFGGARMVAPLGDPLRAETTWHALAFTVQFADEAFIGRVLVPKMETEQAAPLAMSRDRLRALGRVPLSVPIVAALVQMSTSELADLAIGDALVLAPGTLRAPPCLGTVWLAGAQQEGGCRAEITAGGRVVLRSTLDDADPDYPIERANEESSMARSDANEDEDQSREADSLLAALGDAPVVVRVEIGVAEMPAREWAELGPGDVVALGRRIAEPVVLRVAGREVARGELVDLEGEVGVRIMSRGEG